METLQEHLARDIWHGEPVEMLRRVYEGRRPSLIDFGAGVGVLFDWPRKTRYMTELPPDYIEQLTALYREVFTEGLS